MRVPVRPTRVILGLLGALGIVAAILGVYVTSPAAQTETMYQRAALAPEATNTARPLYMPLLMQAVTLRPTPTSTPTSTATATRVLSPTPTPTATIQSTDYPLLWAQSVNGHWQIYKRVGNGQPTLVSQTATVDDVDPALSWDGQAIAFATNRDYPSCPTHYEIYRMDINGGSVTRLTNTDATCPPTGNNVASVTNMNPTWSPPPTDASGTQWIAFASDAGAFDGFDIYRVPANATTPIDIRGDNQYTYRLTWPQSPDQPTSTPIGPTATSTPTSTPYISPTPTGAPTSSPYDNFYRSSSSRMPSYSPDGTMIVFASNRRGDNAARGGRDQIWVMTADGYNLRQLTFALGTNTWPRWSPQGNRIAYASNRTGNWEIYSITPNGTGDMQITVSQGGTVSSQPTWSGSGAQIAYASSSGGNVLVYAINQDGSGTPTAIASGPLYAPAWSP
ncbi:MAG: hypothetical protein U0822_06495 [Anaerolineae bacterium]